MSILALHGVHKSHGSGAAKVCALKDVPLDIRRGDVCAVAGASGSGKSTLLALMGLLDRPDAGRIRLEGEEVGTASANRLAALRGRRIGFVFQSFHLLPRLTALDNVALPFLYRGTSPRACRGRAAKPLIDQGIIPRQEYEDLRRQAEAQTFALAAANEELAAALKRGGAEVLRMAELEHAGARAKVEDLRAQLDRSVVKAPVSGVVLPAPSAAISGPPGATAVEAGGTLFANRILFASPTSARWRCRRASMKWTSTACMSGNRWR